MASAGSSPARSSDDLPEPDAPTRITGSGVSSCSVIRISRSVTARWRPWNQPASACSKPRSPGYGPSATAAGTGGRAPVLRRTARTRYARSCPGSGPDAVAPAIPVVSPPPRAACAASISSPTPPNRRAGSFAIPRSTTASSSGGIVGTNCDGAGGGRIRCAAIAATGSSSGNGSRPARHSNSTQASEYWSARPSTCSPDSRSGAR